MKYLLLAIFFISCSSKEVREDISCNINLNTVDKKALLINVKSNSHKLGDCLNNYIKFSKTKSVDYQGCVRLLVSKRGQTRKVSISSKNFPPDLKMCIEQELWTFNFSKLYLDHTTQIQFPVDFKLN